MVMRKRPHCSKPSFSADATNEWACIYCGASIGKELNETPTETQDPYSKQV